MVTAYSSGTLGPWEQAYDADGIQRTCAFLRPWRGRHGRNLDGCVGAGPLRSLLNSKVERARNGVVQYHGGAERSVDYAHPVPQPRPRSIRR